MDFADVELAPLHKDNLRRLMHEDVLAYRPELRSPAAGSSLPESSSVAGGREAARDGHHGSRSSSSSMPHPPANGSVGSNGVMGSRESSHASSRLANGGGGGPAHAHSGVGSHRERSSRSDREGRSSMSGTGRSAGGSGRVIENGMVGTSSTSRSDGRTHGGSRMRSGGVGTRPYPTEG